LNSQGGFFNDAAFGEQEVSKVSVPRRSIKQDLTNLPNILTMARIAAIPLVIFLMFMSEFHPNHCGTSLSYTLKESQTFCWLAWFVFTAAAITDYLDGYLARSRKLTTIIGKFLDPMADKLIVLATLVGLVQLQRIDSWIVILILLREISINTFRTLAIAEGLKLDVISIGKYKTAFQLFGIGALIINYEYPVPFLNIKDTIDFNALGNAFIVISLLFSLWSAISYIRTLFHGLEEKYPSND
jgi:CDP-diacylglycerol---glycerol-3-phosphate 3-phosphatidyltransferase